MKKEYWIILITYVGMQFSSVLGVPLFIHIGTLFGTDLNNIQTLAVAYWIVISFTITLVITLALLQKDIKSKNMLRDSASPSLSAAWAIGGVFLALIAQSIAANVERLLGIEMGSENTQQIIMIIKASPIVILVSSIIGPILEEIVFRKIIFGSLYNKFNFFISALLSSVIFALAHTEFEHILLYSAMGFTFAFLYVKTRRIIVPIFAHVVMNTLVVILQLYREEIENWLKGIENIQAFIGGLL